MEAKCVLKGAVVASLFFAAATARADAMFNVSLDTSSVAAMTEQVVFELIDGDGIIDNSVLLSNFGLGGGTVAGIPDYLGTTGVTGDLSSSIAMNDSGGMALFTQLLTFGSSLSFLFTTSNSFSGNGAPDAFSMALYAPDFRACWSNDQTSCVLLQLNLTGATLNPTLFTLNGASNQGLPAPVVTLAGTVPEPATLPLLAIAGLVAFLRSRVTMRRRSTCLVHEVEPKRSKFVDFQMPIAIRFQPRNALSILTLALMATVFATRHAEADSPKPKETPTEVIVINFGKLETTYKVDGSKGPDIAVQGTLHIASQALLAGDGTPIGFTLHTNLSDAFAANVDGAASYVAVTASDGIPAECRSSTCAPPFWTLTFRLMPNGAVLQPSLLFDVILVTDYAAGGTLLNACVAGEEGCGAGIP
jgi:hypothetical protein